MDYDIDIFQAVVALQRGSSSTKEVNFFTLRNNLRDRIRHAISWELVEVISQGRLKPVELDKPCQFIDLWNEMALIPREVLLEEVEPSDDQVAVCLKVGEDLANGVLPGFLREFKSLHGQSTSYSHSMQEAREVAEAIDIKLRSGDFSVQLDEQAVEFVGWVPVDIINTASMAYTQ